MNFAQLYEHDEVNVRKINPDIVKPTLELMTTFHENYDVFEELGK